MARKGRHSLVGSATAQESRIAQVDQLYLQRFDLSSVSEAISLLAEVVDEDAENYEALWRLTKYYYFPRPANGFKSPIRANGERDCQIS